MLPIEGHVPGDRSLCVHDGHRIGDLRRLTLGDNLGGERLLDGKRCVIRRGDLNGDIPGHLGSVVRYYHEGGGEASNFGLSFYFYLRQCLRRSRQLLGDGLPRFNRGSHEFVWNKLILLLHRQRGCELYLEHVGWRNGFALDEYLPKPFSLTQCGVKSLVELLLIYESCLNQRYTQIL